jgi:hypothetical protein
METLLLPGGGEWTPSGGLALERRFVELTARFVEESPCSCLAVANGLQAARALLRRESWQIESRRELTTREYWRWSLGTCGASTRCLDSS